MTLQHLPRIRVDKIDGNLVPTQASRAPRVLIVGTAGKGIGDQEYVVSTTTVARSEFGSEGTLNRGMWEAIKGGALEVSLYRIGATPASLTGVGDTTGLAGYTITTEEQDADAGGNYALYYDNSADRLVVKRNSDDLVVFDNEDPTNVIDLFEVVVSGFRATGGGVDIGSASSFVDLEDVDASTYPGTSFTAGTDGLSLSRMEMYEQLYVAYKDLLMADFDVIVPMDVYLDDYNVIAQGHRRGAVAPAVPTAQTYPTAGIYRPGVAGVADIDSLGRVYIEEYEGDYYFWWWFGVAGASFAAAEIFPSVGLASATLKIDGTALDADDFHEVNFGYQLGRFLYDYSSDIVDATGVLGVLPPESNSLRDRALWLGKAPTWTQNSTTGEYTIASAGGNGSGLLGNKFMVGRSDHRVGVFGGGFILTNSEFMDGTELLDSNDIEIDLGKYLSITSDTAWLRNNWYAAGYQSTIAASYAGFYVGMPPFSAPTNKRVNNGIGLVYGFNIDALDNLAGAGYVVLRRKPQGLVIGDAPTATLPNSDWRRLSTVRIVKDIIDGVRAVGERYLGESLSEGAKSSLYTGVEKVLQGAKKIGSLKDYKPFQIIQTPSMAVNGEAEINLVLIPAFELRVITVPISLAKSQ